ncbi:MAG: HlyD family secretion protein [Chromatiales bacterium]|nr:HlyD family secretion protein [Chromatiales bacterium]
MSRWKYITPPHVQTGRALPFVRGLVLLLIAAGLFTWAYGWATTAWKFVRETDARVAADMFAFSSRLNGRLIKRPVEAGQTVKIGQILAALDDRDARIRLEELQAEHARLVAERDEYDARIAVVQHRTRSRVAVENAKLAAAGALVDAIKYEFDYARREMERAQKLSGQGVMSAKSLDESQTTFLMKQKEMVRSRADVASARARLDEVGAEIEEVSILERERATLERRGSEALVRIERQRVELGDHVIKSPIDGVVSKVFVEPGEYVQAGQRIVLVHNPAKIYVDANIRETDIRRVQLGQMVRIEVDAYPDQAMEGKVGRIGDAATSQFALLPSPNPSGHFTKVTQRLPVRIDLTQGYPDLKPGMMVEVFIHVGGQ